MSSSVFFLFPSLLLDLASIFFLTILYLCCSCYTPSSRYNIPTLCFHLQKNSISFVELLLQRNEINLGKEIKIKSRELLKNTLVQFSKKQSAKIQSSDTFCKNATVKCGITQYFYKKYLFQAIVFNCLS